MGMTAVCLSNSKCSKSGFANVEEAEKYVGENICSTCRSDLEKGYIEYGSLGEERYDIKSPMSTSCGAEWLIITDEEFEASDDITDIFIASGMKPVEGNLEAQLSPKQISKLDQKQAEIRDNNG